MKSNRLLVVMAICGMLLCSSEGRGAEGGGSHYLQGTSGEFLIALAQPPGVFVRNDLIYNEGTVGPVTLGRFALTDFDQKVWINTFKMIGVTTNGILNGSFGSVLTVPYVINAEASGTFVTPTNVTVSGSRSGFGDPVLTLFLRWSDGETQSFMGGLSIYSDFGSYSADRTINLGRNYWSFDPAFSYTWFHPRRRHEFSFSSGMMFNTENEATDYQTGTEWHTDFILAQHFSKEFRIALVGYYYSQISDDRGRILGRLPVGSSGFRSESLGLGVAAGWTWNIAGKDVALIGKWMRDLDATRRFDTDMFLFSLAFKL